MYQLSRFAEAHFQGAAARLKSAPNSDVRARAQQSFSQIKAWDLRLQITTLPTKEIPWACAKSVNQIKSAQNNLIAQNEIWFSSSCFGNIGAYIKQYSHVCICAAEIFWLLKFEEIIEVHCCMYACSYQYIIIYRKCSAGQYSNCI